MKKIPLFIGIIYLNLLCLNPVILAQELNSKAVFPDSALSINSTVVPPGDEDFSKITSNMPTENSLTNSVSTPTADSDLVRPTSQVPDTNPIPAEKDSATIKATDRTDQTVPNSQLEERKKLPIDVEKEKSSTLRENGIFNLTQFSSGTTESLTPTFNPTDPKTYLQNFQGRHEVSLFTGALNYSYPLWVPKGRLGMTPEVALTYSSLDHYFGSATGLGWSLPTNAVYRVPKKGVDQTYTTDRFAVDIFGKNQDLILIDAANQIYAPKVEGDFSQFIFNANSWIAIDAKGTRYTFGQSAVTRQDDPANNTRIFKWMLEKIQDTNGNFMTFTYTKLEGAIYPNTIRYTGFGADNGLFEIQFHLQDRPVYQAYRSGFLISYQKLVDRIDLVTYANGNPQVFLTYAFHYIQQNNAISLLDKITVSAGNQSLPPTLFNYYDGTETTANKQLNAIKKITTPYGGIHTFTYKASSSFREPDSSSSNMLPFATYTVFEHQEQANVNDPVFTTTYDYRYGHYFVDNLDAFVREYSGFGKVSVTDPAGNVHIIYFHQSQFDSHNTSNALIGEYQDNISKKGLMYRDEQWDNTQHLKKAVIQKWDQQQLADADSQENRFFPFLAQTTSIDYGENNLSKVSAATYLYDNYGNRTEEKQYGEVTLQNQTGAFSDIGNDLRTTQTTYAINVPTRLLRFASKEERFNQQNSLVSRKKLSYDNLPWGQIQKGNVSKEDNFLDANNAVSTQIFYEPHGLVQAITNPRGYNTQTVYDGFSLYPQTVINAKNQVTTFAYDTKFGVPLTIINPNNGVTQYVLDNFGMLTQQKVKAPNNQMKVLKDVSYDLVTNPVSITQILHSDSTDAQNAPIDVTAKTYFDGLGRKIQEKTETEGANSYSVSSISYDDRGNIKEEYLPKFTATLNYEIPNSSNPKISSVYDALNRPKTITNTLGVTKITWNNWKKIVIDSNGKEKDFGSDAYGNLIEVKEYLNGAAYSTFYEYNANNNLTKILDAKGNLRNFNYDFIGQKLSQEDLHTINDTTFGVWNYQYDENGNLKTQTDPKTQTVQYGYDELDRILTEDYVGNAGTETTYSYDQGLYGIGKLSGVVGANFQKALTYDILGRLVQEQKTIDNILYSTNFTADLLGNPLSMTYPDGEALTYYYNNAAFLEKVKRNGVEVVTNLNYAPTGAVNQINDANGVSTTKTYDPQKLYRLTNILTTKGTTKFQDLTYAFDAVGNITLLTDVSNHKGAKKAIYIYDDLSRLMMAAIINTANSQNYTHNYTYDILGNILSRSDVGVYQYAGGVAASSIATTANPDAVTKVGTSNYSYDPNGNLTSDGVWTHSWDYKDRLSSSTDGIKTIQYFYDEGSERLKKLNQTSGKQTIYVNQYYEVEDGGIRKHVYAGGAKVASIEPGNALIYHHTDSLSGSNVDSDAQGNILELLDYFPFGNVRLDEKTGTYANHSKFTGKELDGDTDLYYYGARYYQAKIGRFLSLDPWQGDLNDPQSFNKYAYARNNPLRYTDPTGKFSIDDANKMLDRMTETNNQVGDFMTFGQFSSAFKAAGEASQRARAAYDQGKLTPQVVGSETANVVGSETANVVGEGLKLSGTALFNGMMGGEMYLQGKGMLGSDSSNDTKLLNPPIKNIDKKMEEHIIPDHTGLDPTRSSFNPGVDIKGLIQRSTQMPMVQSGRNFIRTFDAVDIIGTDRATNQPTSIMNVITDKLNNLKSAYPGTVKIHK